jgi:hypothetical protein
MSKPQGRLWKGLAASAATAALAACLVGAAPAAAQFGPVPPEYASLPNTWNPGTFATAREQYDARKAAANGGTRHTSETLPDWSGVWENAPGSGFSMRPGERMIGRGFATETSMKLTPRYAAEHEMRMRWGEEGRDFDPLSYCLPAGFPRWLVEPFLKEYIPTPDRTLLINEMMSEVRRVYTDGRDHIPADYAFPLWEGDSIGFWDGETLVVHTNNLKANLYQREQPAHSDKVETVEEWTMIRDGLMELKISIYDPEALLEPHHSIRYYRRIDDQNGGVRIGYWSCEENQPVVRGADGGSTFGGIPGQENAGPNLNDPETWLAFDEAREAGLLDGIEDPASSGGDE